METIVDLETREELRKEMRKIIREMMEEKDPTKFRDLNERLKVLANLLKEEKPTEKESVDKRFFDKVDPNVIVSAATNLLGILLIIGHEKLDIISSKAISFVSKTRV
jgi:hypothetical protein